MTDEEKKEFEEFLKWKAEKAKLEEQEELAEQDTPTVPPVEAENTYKEQEADPESQNQTNTEVEEKTDNTGIIIAIVVVVLLILGFIVFGLSNKKKEAQPAVPAEENIIDDDSIAVVEADAVDNVFSEPTKVVWDFLIEKDEMTDSKNIWASITSDNYVTQDFPYEGQTRTTITVRYMKKYGYDVLIQISQGQMNGREYYGTNYITARFDDNSPKKYYFNESADGDSKVVFIRKSSDFIKNCKKAKDIKIDLPLYQGGRPVFTFHVDEPLVWKEDY